jgi:hypothetical protein
LPIDDVDAVLDAGLLDAPDVRVRPPLPVAREQVRQLALRQPPGAQVFPRQLGEQVRRMHERLFRGLTHGRLDLLQHLAQDEPARERHKAGVDQEQTSGERELPKLHAPLERGSGR